MYPASLLLLATSGLGVEAAVTLWHGELDAVPPYFSGANVSLTVRQDGEHRDFIWDSAWLGSAIGAEVNMGRMVCPLPESERNVLAAMSPEQRRHLVLPCNIRDPEQLLAGSDIVRQIVFSVAALGARRVAMVGLGPGTMATYWQRYHPQIERIDVVEMSSTVADVARRYFGLHPDQRLRVHVAEGMDWLRSAEPFDVFVHDATGSEHCFLWPSSLRLIREKTNGGAMVVNVLGMPSAMKALLVSYLRLKFYEVRTYSHVVVASWTPIAMRWDQLPGHVQGWQEEEMLGAQQGLDHRMLLLVMALGLAGLVRALSSRPSQPVQSDQELASLSKLHPRARSLFRARTKECPLAPVSYGVF